MKTMSFHAEISGDGVLRLEVPCDLPPGPAEVVVVVQPERGDPIVAVDEAPRRARSGLFAAERLRSSDLDPDSALEEMNSMWKAKFSDVR